MAGVAINAGVALTDEDIFAEAGDRSVKEKFIFAVKGLGAGREDFDDRDRVEDLVVAVAVEGGVAVENHQVGVEAAIVVGYPEAEVAAEGLEGGIAQEVFEQGEEVSANATMFEGASGHGDDFSVAVFVALLGLGFALAVLVGGVAGEGGHGATGGG